ncbi:hypothetical protein [Phaffia rhodozyma]|uniref:Uncharacterized protein n=1 Tax=Phaffia rhodozyma TaxID=264483 RepID=A0A0F7SRN0_PHARH|nr:hypothetical protein [Phaffia rhodozyma]
MAVSPPAGLIKQNDYAPRQSLPSASFRNPTHRLTNSGPNSSSGPNSNASSSGVNAGSHSADQSLDPTAYLDKAEEEWNVLVDREVSGLGDGLGEVMAGFGIETTNNSSPLTPLSISLRSSSLLRNTTNLLKLSHDLKLLLLLNMPDAALSSSSSSSGPIGNPSLNKPENGDGSEPVVGSDERSERDRLILEIEKLQAEVDELKKPGSDINLIHAGHT